MIDVAILSHGSVGKKENKKLEKYQGLREELEEMWRVKATVVLWVVGRPEAAPTDPRNNIHIYMF